MSNDSTALTKRQGISGSIEINSLDEVARVANMMAQSGFFGDARNAEQAGVKIIAGMELGIPPMASMRGIHVFDGNTTLSGPLLASLIKKHPRYDYRIRRADREGAEIAFFENGEEVGTASFDKQDAKSAGLLGKQNWRKYPTDMYVWRTLARGQRWYCPDVGDGALYTPDEMGSETDKQGNPIDVGDAKVVREESAPSGDSAPAQPSEPAPESETSAPDTATWRGETINAKQARVLEKLQARFDDCDTAACTFDIAQKAKGYAEKWPDTDAQRIHTITREAEVSLHDGEVLSHEAMEAARNAGGSVLAHHLHALEKHHKEQDAWGEVQWQAMPWITTANLQRCGDKQQAAAITRQGLQHCAEGEAEGHYTEQERVRAESIIAEAAYHLHDIDADALEQTDDAEADDDLFGKPALSHNDQG